MRMLASLLVLALAACGQTTAPADDPPAVEEVAAPEGEPMSAGLMGGISTSASGEVSAVTIGADQFAFTDPDGAETFTVATEYLGVVDVSTLIAEGGESFAAVAPSATATRVELRRIMGDLPDRFCDATYAAIVSTEPLTGLQLMLFTGADAPGPTARDSAVCFIAAYAVD
ncbi:MAG: hypothetical protein K2X34_13695 [Hyphomonadaceae bacterium]|nr:hypothetical protein [Hyphomonadaceae bacterium]